MQYTTHPLFRLFVVALLATSFVACGEDDVSDNDDLQNQNQNQNQDDEHDPDDMIDPDDHDIDVAGNWQTQFDTREDIDDDEWTFVYEDNDDLSQKVIDFDNEERWAITQNPEDADFGPGTYNRSVWTAVDEDHFYYCTVDFGLESEEEAYQSDQTADDSEPEEGGCAGNPWTEMNRL